MNAVWLFRRKVKVPDFLLSYFGKYSKYSHKKFTKIIFAWSEIIELFTLGFLNQGNIGSFPSKRTKV